jgi:exodeoxyribonuclease VII large subunit
MELPKLTVIQLNRQIRLFLEQDIGEISVIGELSNVSKPASGHIYFTLKDDLAQLKCAFFRNYHRPPQQPFADGQQVIARGLVSLYEARGEYQLIVHELTPYGLGELYRQFELLKDKLEKLGLFAKSRKRSLPRYPQRIAVITSKTGAALHDILITLARRYPLVEVDVYASEVQGKNAASQLIHRLKQVNHQERACDLIILARGGGSLEDLWSFNDEQLAYAIYNSRIPVITGIGHESDVTMADFVSDLRAATPTAAAEAATPSQDELYQIIDSYSTRITNAIQRILAQHNMAMTHLRSQLSYPTRLIQHHAQKLDFLQRQLQRHPIQRLHHFQHRLDIALSNIKAHNPKIIVERASTQLQSLEAKLVSSMQNTTYLLKETFSTYLTTLNAVSPLATLNRGYAIATHNHQVLHDSHDIHCGDSVNVQLSRGMLVCEVISCSGSNLIQ